MQFVNYNVAVISATGRVIPKENVRYTDAATEKSIKLDLSREFNVSPDAVVISELSRKSV
ncbi:hypothetical protein [Stenotrophomonas phage StenM_174]|nr:hypothetical protein [Stenotrophomonas phage StenM_174]